MVPTLIAFVIVSSVTSIASVIVPEEVCLINIPSALVPVPEESRVKRVPVPAFEICKTSTAPVASWSSFKIYPESVPEVAGFLKINESSSAVRATIASDPSVSLP